MNDRINFFITCDKTHCGLLLDALVEVGNPVAEVYSSKLGDNTFEAAIRLTMPVLDVTKFRNSLQLRFYKCAIY